MYFDGVFVHVSVWNLCFVQELVAETSDTEEKYAVAVVMSPEHYQVPDPSVPNAIILDLSPVNFLDTVGVKTLRNVRTLVYTILVKLVFVIYKM